MFPVSRIDRSPGQLFVACAAADDLVEMAFHDTAPGIDVLPDSIAFRMAARGNRRHRRVPVGTAAEHGRRFRNRLSRLVTGLGPDAPEDIRVHAPPDSGVRCEYRPGGIAVFRPFPGHGPAAEFLRLGVERVRGGADFGHIPCSGGGEADRRRAVPLTDQQNERPGRGIPAGHEGEVLTHH